MTTLTMKVWVSETQVEFCIVMQLANNVRQLVNNVDDELVS